MDAIRNCQNCRHWSEPTTECRCYPPPFPITAPDLWCGRFAARGAARGGPQPKVSDADIVGMVIGATGPFTDNNGKQYLPRPMTKADAVWTLGHDYKMGRTPAYKRLDRLVRDGLLEYVAMDDGKIGVMPVNKPWDGDEAAVAEKVATGDQLLVLVRALCPTEDKAKTMRAICRAVQDSLPCSLTTVHRHLNQLVADGLVSDGPNGYWSSGE